MPEKIDLAAYPRRSTYQAFLHHDVPVFTATCELDITALYAFRRRHGLRLFPLLAYLIDKSMNALEAMRHRIISGELYAFEVVHPSFTTLQSDNTLSFCDALHDEDAASFYGQIVALTEHSAEVAGDVEMREKHGRYFISNIPWLRFSSFSHPYVAHYASIPIVTLGKLHDDGSAVTMPVALQLHHSLADGYHMGQFYALLEQNFRDAERLLDELKSRSNTLQEQP